MASTPSSHPFGRFTREDCGLPELGSPLPDSGLSFSKGFILVAALALAGWFAGHFSARHRVEWVTQLPARVYRASIDQIPGLLERGKLYATALPEDQALRCNLAYAVIVASERSPRRLGYLANAANLFRGLEIARLPTIEDRFHALLTASGTYADLGEYADAFRSLDEAEKVLRELPEATARSHRLALINAKAYFLCEAPTAQGGDTKQGLRLASLVISSKDRLANGSPASSSAAFLDTFALACYKTGDRTRALDAQALALGMATNMDVSVYLKHYDDFSMDQSNRSRKRAGSGIVDPTGVHKTYIGDTNKIPVNRDGHNHNSEPNNEAARGTNGSISQ